MYNLELDVKGVPIEDINEKVNKNNCGKVIFFIDILAAIYIFIFMFLYFYLNLHQVVKLAENDIFFFFWCFFPISYAFWRKPNTLQVFFKKPCYIEDITDYMTVKMKKKIYDQMMKDNAIYLDKKKMLKRVAKLHTKILSNTINVVTSVMLSFVLTYVKHKVEQEHEDFVETWTICLVQIQSLKPIHNLSGKFIMWFLLKHKMFIDSESSIELEDCESVESSSPQEISMSDFRKDLWNMFIKH